MTDTLDALPADEYEFFEPIDLNAALQLVLKRALLHKGVTRGLRQTVMALDRNVAHLCVMADDCNVGAVRELIMALCKENSIDLIFLPEKKELGKYVGLTKYNRDGTIKKQIGVSCVAVTDYGGRSLALDMIQDHFAPI
eukprot:Rhum_TRINITY_DN8246_c0_g1::Rhum_TRINITY_DN8246_c0_g1_i1::g.26754::m.26754/K02951/RP-S12e, RPS12; small subunit ribosomal protein S12e